MDTRDIQACIRSVVNELRDDFRQLSLDIRIVHESGQAGIWDAGRGRGLRSFEV